jgi:hypothetical protein
MSHVSSIEKLNRTVTSFVIKRRRRKTTTVKMQLIRENQMILQVENDAIMPIEVKSSSVQQVQCYSFTQRGNESSHTVPHEDKCYVSLFHETAHCRNIRNDYYTDRTFQVSNEFINKKLKCEDEISHAHRLSCDDNVIQKASSSFDSYMKPLRPLPEGKPLRCHPRLGHCNLMVKSSSSSYAKRKFNSDDLRKQTQVKKVCGRHSTCSEHEPLNEYEKEKQNNQALLVRNVFDSAIQPLIQNPILTNVKLNNAVECIKHLETHAADKIQLTDIDENCFKSFPQFSNMALLTFIAVQLSDYPDEL